jgi:hypothetical protein
VGGSGGAENRAEPHPEPPLLGAEHTADQVISRILAATTMRPPAMISMQGSGKPQPPIDRPPKVHISLR